jgi:hypothetical protein
MDEQKPVSPDEGIDDRSWIPDHAIEALNQERHMQEPKSDIEFTREQFRQSAPHAAAAIVHLALHSQNERIRLQSAQYVVERVLGRPGEENPHGRTPLEALMEGVLQLTDEPTIIKGE